MGKSSGGLRGLQAAEGGSGGGAPTGIEDLRNIKDPQVYRDMKDAISRYHSVLGVRERSVKLANLPDSDLGQHITDVASGTSVSIFLNKKYFNQSRSSIIKAQRARYAEGWSTHTNKPIAHTVTHELAHATWNSALKGAKYKAAGKEIYRLSARWLADRKKSGYGKYAHSNLDEFWAETVTKAVHGKSDAYTRAVKRIIKKYEL